MHIDALVAGVHPGTVYVLVALVIGVESLGIPLPGEVALVSASLLAADGTVDPLLVGVCATVGAVLGDSAGYAIGRRGGRSLFDRLARVFPRHFGPGHLAAAQRSFQRWGMWAVFFGRFVALLRIFAGPLAGALRMPYWRFLVANVLGGVVWAGGTTAAVYSVGVVAERWLKGFSWVGLAAAVLIGAGSMVVVRRRGARHRTTGPAGSDTAGRDAPPARASSVD